MTSKAGKQFRKRAEEQRDAATVILEREDFTDEDKRHVAAVVGQVNATMYEAMADLLDVLEGTDSLNRMMAARQKVATQNALMREAAAKGDWDEFNRVVAGVTGGSAAGGDGNE